VFATAHSYALCSSRRSWGPFASELSEFYEILKRRARGKEGVRGMMRDMGCWEKLRTICEMGGSPVGPAS
jgi:hypothetical protein